MNKKYWLGGGILGFVMAWALILFNALNTWDTGYGHYIDRGISESIIFFPQGVYPANPTFYQSHWYLIPIVFYTIVVGIIGWVYGKMKNRQRGTTMK